MRPKLRLAIALICVTTLMTNITYGQTSANQDTTNWPKDKDAVVSDKKNHKILLENDTVRVLQVTILPGEKEAIHYHQWPSVLYVMEGGDFIDRDAQGNVIFDSRKTPLPKPPTTLWTSPEAPHAIENLSKTQTIRIIRIEIKK